MCQLESLQFASSHHKLTTITTGRDPTNNGASGSPQCDRGTDVDFWHNSEPGTDGCHIGWTEPSEVLSYPLGSLIDEAGHYDIVLRLGSAFSGKQVRARVVYTGDKGTPTVAEADVTAQAQGWGVFDDGLAISDLSLQAHGAYILEIEHLTGGLDFNGFELHPSIESTIVEAEDYFTYSDNTMEDVGLLPNARVATASTSRSPLIHKAAPAMSVGERQESRFIGTSMSPSRANTRSSPDLRAKLAAASTCTAPTCQRKAHFNPLLSQ